MLISSGEGRPLKEAMDLVFYGKIPVTKPANSTQANGTLVHNLGFQPAILAYAVGVTNQETYYPVPRIFVETTGAQAGLMSYKLDAVANTEEIDCWIITPNIGPPEGLYEEEMSIVFHVYCLRQSLLID